MCPIFDGVPLLQFTKISFEDVDFYIKLTNFEYPSQKLKNPADHSVQALNIGGVRFRPIDCHLVCKKKKKAIMIL